MDTATAIDYSLLPLQQQQQQQQTESAMAGFMGFRRRAHLGQQASLHPDDFGGRRSQWHQCALS